MRSLERADDSPGRTKAEAQRWAAAVGAPEGSGRPSVPVARRRRIKQLGASDCQDRRRGPPRVMVIADPRRRLASHELLAALHLVAFWHKADLKRFALWCRCWRISGHYAAYTRSPAPIHECTALTRPRRAAQRLRRLAEGADEGAAHPLGIAKAGRLRDAFDRLA